MRIPESFETTNAVNKWPGQVKLLGDLKQLAQRNVELDDSLVLMIYGATFELSESQLVKLVNDEEVDVDYVISFIHSLLR